MHTFIQYGIILSSLCFWFYIDTIKIFKTDKKIIEQKYISYILTHMEDNGLYEQSDDWMKTIGFPFKSGVSGIVMIVIPGVMGIGIISPPLNNYGNSVKGIKTAKLLLPLFVKK